MNAARFLVAGVLASAAGGILLAGGTPGSLPLRGAAASVPADSPTFPDPLTIDNPYFPLQPGGVHVYEGREGSRRNTILVQHLQETRTISWQGGDVPCRILRELKFRGGRCTEISRSYFAQAADGGVYYFGEIPEPLPPVPGDDGPDEPGDTESNGWVVVGPGPGDPPDTATAPAPTLFMPAAPEAGDSWKSEDLFPVVDERDTVQRRGLPVTTAAGRFGHCLEVLEEDGIDRTAETKWYAPGTGVVRSRSKFGILTLRASTSRRR